MQDSLPSKPRDPRSNRGRRTKPTTEERFYAKVDKAGPNGCWLWTGCLNSQGYGCFAEVATRHSHRLVLAHRFAWELANRQVAPADKQVMHACDVRNCVAPSHLSIGDATLNALDMVAKGRHVPRAKLTPAQVAEIRRAAATERKYGLAVRFARRFGLHECTVRSILKGRSWRSPVLAPARRAA